MKIISSISKPEPSHRKPHLNAWEQQESTDPNYRSVFLDMKRQWSNEIAEQIMREKKWQQVAILALGVALVCAGGMVYLGTQNKLVPYVVEVDKLGMAVAIQRADTTTQADPRIIRAQLARWIENVRSIYQDAGAERVNLNNAYAMVRKNDAAYTTLNEYFSQNDPFKRAESEGVNVEISTVMPISENTWQVEWSENVHSSKGELLRTTPMQAHLTVAIDPPTDESALLKNPMGVYITHYNWSARL